MQDVIRQRRADLGLSQAELADRVDVDRRQIGCVKNLALTHFRWWFGRVVGGLSLLVWSGLAMVDVDLVVRTVFSRLAALAINEIEDAGEVIVVHARTRGGAVECPSCGTLSRQVHAFHE